MIFTCFAFIQNHIRSLSSTFLVVVMLFGAIWAHIADQFERTVITTLKEWESKGQVHCQSYKINKFSLTLQLEKPSISVNVFGGTLCYASSQSLFVNYNFLRKMAVIWATGNSEIYFEKNHVVTPLICLEATENKNNFKVYCISRYYFPRFVSTHSDRKEDDQMIGWHAIQSIEVQAHRIEALLGKQSQGFLKTLTPHLAIESSHHGGVVCCDYLGYTLWPLKTEKNHQGEDVWTFKDIYSDINYMFHYGVDVPSSQKIEGHSAHEGFVVITLKKDDHQKKLKKENHVVSSQLHYKNMCDALFSIMDLHIKREGTFVHQGYQHHLYSTFVLESLQKKMMYESKGEGVFFNNAWKLSSYDYVCTLNEWIAHKTHSDLKKLSNQDIDMILPNLAISEPHQTQFKWSLQDEGTGYMITLSGGYVAHNHQLNITMNLPILKDGLMQWLDGTNAFTHQSPIFGRITGTIQMKQQGRLFDALQSIAQRYNDVIKDPLLGQKIQTLRLFADYWVSRVGNLSEKDNTVSLPFVYEPNQNHFDIGNGKNYDDLIVRFLPAMMAKPKFCVGSNCLFH